MTLNVMSYFSTSTFCTNGTVKMQHCYWARGHPNWTEEAYTQYLQRATVAWDLHKYHCRCFCTVTDENYLEMLRTVVPYLTLRIVSSIWFKQDEVGPHSAGMVRHFLKETFTNLWIRQRDIERPVRSVYLLCTFSWRFFKRKC